MKVIVPLGGIEPRSTFGRSLVEADDVAIVLRRQVYVAVADGGPYREGEFFEDRRFGVVANLIDSVEPQAIEAILFEPVYRILDKEVAHRPAIVGDGGAPGGLAPWSEEFRRGEVQVVAVGTEVSLDDVEQHHEAPLVGGVHQPL
jgi:hypothetical protein